MTNPAQSPYSESPAESHRWALGGAWGKDREQEMDEALQGAPNKSHRAPCADSLPFNRPSEPKYLVVKSCAKQPRCIHCCSSHCWKHGPGAGPLSLESLLRMRAGERDQAHCQGSACLSVCFCAQVSSHSTLLTCYGKLDNL